MEQSSMFDFHRKCRAMNIVNLYFAGDLLLFSKVFEVCLRLFGEVLNHFFGLSGFRANPIKSNFILSKSAQHN
ncbi:UNVERIFIED_CONTAM: hypothetical protein Slati_2409600 [Sesamum latifolium]|uniref:Reverse transcriptase n=1 Tax=Sesamum latifolium TaxID=2727402 RepID=A0AAW2WD96_9LAMI